MLSGVAWRWILDAVRTSGTAPVVPVVVEDRSRAALQLEDRSRVAVQAVDTSRSRL